MDGFSGKHIKIFIDGIPQEGVGNSFGLNNIPVNFAERIEVYKGVVPKLIRCVFDVLSEAENNQYKIMMYMNFSSYDQIGRAHV